MQSLPTALPASACRPYAAATATAAATAAPQAAPQSIFRRLDAGDKQPAPLPISSAAAAAAAAATCHNKASATMVQQHQHQHQHQHQMQCVDGITSTNTAFNLQSPSICRVGRLEFPSPSPDVPPSPLLPLSIFTPVSMSKTRHALDDDTGLIVCKKLDWNSMNLSCGADAQSDCTPCSLSKNLTPIAEKIWNQAASPEYSRPKLLLFCGLQCLLDKRDVDLARQCLAFSLSKWNVSIDRTLHDLAMIWCFRCIWMPHVDHNEKEPISFIVRERASGFVQWFIFQAQRNIYEDKHNSWAIVPSIVKGNNIICGRDIGCFFNMLREKFGEEYIRSDFICCQMLNCNKDQAKLCQDLIGSDISNLPLANNIAVFLMRQNDFPSAVSILKQCAEFPKASPILRAQIFSNLFIAFLCMGDRASAISAIAQAEMVDGKKDLSILRVNLASCLISSANQAINSNSRAQTLAAARELLQEVERTHPSAFCFNCFGKLFAMEASVEEDEGNAIKLRQSASEYFIKALRLSPFNLVTWNEFGRLHLTEGDFESAEKFFKFILDRHPNHSGVLTNYGLCLHLGQKLGEAEATYKRVIELDATSCVAWNNLGSLYHDRWETSKAQHAYEQCLAIDENHVSALSNLALLHISQERFKDAESVLLRALDIDPHNDIARSNLVKLRILCKKR